jgi:archaellum component FlaC
MFSTDFLVSFGFMAILFLRQVYILKQPNKINYAPLMLAIGFIATILHFITYPINDELIVVVRESLFPLLVALILFIIMNIMHQTQQSELAKNQEQFVKVLATELTQLKAFILELEKRMALSSQEDRDAQKAMIEKFKNDLTALDKIQSNQMKFVDMFGDVESSLSDVKKEYKYFSEVQLPELDSVVHKHIDILRVAEQDHYNNIKTMLQENLKDNKIDIKEEIEQLKENIEGIKNISYEIANSIIKHTLTQLSGVTKSFEDQINLLKAHTEGIKTALGEDDTILANIRQQSELLLKQMSLMANKMSDFQLKQVEFSDVYKDVESLVGDIEAIKSDYVKAQSQLSSISTELLETKDKKVLEMKKSLDELSENLSTKIDESLEKLHEHYHIASQDITQSVKTLTKRAQFQKGYGENS